VSAFCLHTCAMTPTQLVTCIVNDSLVNAMPNMQQTLVQFINVVHPRLIDSLLDDVPYIVVDRVEVSTVRWPVEWKHESRRCLLVKSYSVACPARRGAVLLEDEELARHVAHYGQQLLLWQEHVAVVVAVDLYRINGSLTDQRWSTEICEAELWDSNWNHNRLTERCSGADETFSSNLLLLHCCRNVQTVILRIVQGCHCEHLVGEPHEVQESIHVTFSFVFSSIFAKIRTSNFRKVVWQHWRYYRKYYMGFVRNLVLFSVVK